jgi:hypothetical protein
MARERGSKAAKPKAPEIKLPKGRLMNSALFVKDQYDAKSTPRYLVEVCFDKDDPEFDKVLDAILAQDGPLDILGIAGELDIDDGEVVSGIKDGDVKARKREKDGKPGDGYKGKWIVTATTTFNKDGQDGPGGVTVFDEAVEPITAVNQQAIYNGCYVEVLCTLSKYTEEKTGNDAIKWYLGAVQKVADGERFASAKDYSTAFKPAGRAPVAGEGRRRR